MICPVCRRPVDTNHGGRNLAVHNDKAGNRCPASIQPKRITENPYA